MPTLTARIKSTDKGSTTTALAEVEAKAESSSSLVSTSSNRTKTMATHALNSSFDVTATTAGLGDGVVGGGGGAAADVVMPTNSNATTTCTFSTNNRQHFQQQQLSHQPTPSQLNHQHYYSHQHQQQQQQQHQPTQKQQQQQQQHQQYSNTSPSLPPSHHHHHHLDETGFGSGSIAVDSGSVTFNGNAVAAAAAPADAAVSTSTSTCAAADTAGNFSVNNGNIASVVTHSNGNSNVMSANFSKATTATATPSPPPLTTTATTTTIQMHTANTTTYNAIPAENNKLETLSNAGSNSLNGSIKKSSSPSHESREDVASLGGGGGGSSINSQSKAMHNNNSNNNNNNNNSNNIKNINNHSNNNNIHINHFTKDNPLQNYYNSIGGGGRMDGNDDDDDLGPLPTKWETAYTERGELYFIDHNTGTSHWLDPRLSKFQKKSLEDCSDDELPYGWEKIEDSLYGTYYIDHVNRRTQYENPVLEAKRRAAEQRKQLKPPPAPYSGVRECGEYSGSGGLGESVNTGNDPLRCRPPPPPVVVGMVEKTPLPPPPQSLQMLPYKFTRNPAEMQGERITTTLMKSARGLGITIVGGDDTIEQFLQIKSVVPNGPAWLDGQLQTGDILVYVNDICVLGFTHNEMVNVFQSILPGETVVLEVCRGYPLPFDPNDPNTEVVTTIAVDGITAEPEKQRRLLLDLNMDGNYNFLDVSDGFAGGGGGSNNISDVSLKNAAPHASESPGDFILMKKNEVLTFSIVKGAMGFGFTIADSAYGQKVKKILDRNCCKQLQEGDILLEINSVSVRNKTHIDVVQVLKDCSKTAPTTVKIQRSGSNFNGTSNLGGLSNVTKLRKNLIGSNNNGGLFRSKTPTADLYSTQQKEILPIRPKTPLVDTRGRAQTPNNELNDAEVAAATNGIDSNSADTLDHHSLVNPASDNKSPQPDAKSTNSLQELDAIQQEIPFMDPYPKLVTSLSERLAEATLLKDTLGGTHRLHANAVAHSNNYDSQEYIPASCSYSGVGGGVGGYNPIYGMSPMLSGNLAPMQHAVHSSSNSGTLYSPSTMHLMTTTTTPVPTYHHESCYCYECQDYQRYKYRHQQQHHQLQPIQANYYTLQHPQQQQLQHQQQQLQHQQPPLNHHHQQQPLYSPLLHATTAGTTTTPLQAAHIQNERMQKRVNELLIDRRKVGFNPLEAHYSVGLSTGYHLPVSQQQSPAALSQQPHTNWNYTNMLQPVMVGGGMTQVGGAGLTNGGTLTPILRHHLDEDENHQYELTEVTLERQALGFGFRIVGGTEEGSQVTVGHIVPGGAADNDHRIATGDEILSIDGINVVNSSHHKVVSLMGEAALRGQVNMILRRRTSRHLAPMSAAALRHPSNNIRYPYDVIVSRHENEGFGFVIISSSNQYYGSTIGKLIPGSPADRCGELKVGDRIIAVNRIEIAGMCHGDVVQLIKESGLHVRLTIGCPKEGNPLSTSTQASPGSSQLVSQQSSISPSLAVANAGAVGASSAASSTPFLAPSNLSQHQLPQSETPTYFERNAQITQNPQL